MAQLRGPRSSSRGRPGGMFTGSRSAYAGIPAMIGRAHSGKRLDRRRDAGAGNTGASAAMRFFRVAICALLGFSVLAYGGVEEWSQAVVEIGLAWLLVLWALRQYRQQSEQVQLSPLFMPLASLALLVFIQVVFHTTASQYYTRVELQLLIAYVTLLLLLTQAFYRSSHMRGLVWFLMCLAFFVSIFGILQHLTFNGKLYWFRVMRYGGLPFGPYVNRNHFAGFAELLIPVALVPLFLGK